MFCRNCGSEAGTNTKCAWCCPLLVEEKGAEKVPTKRRRHSRRVILAAAVALGGTGVAGYLTYQNSLRLESLKRLHEDRVYQDSLRLESLHQENLRLESLHREDQARVQQAEAQVQQTEAQAAQTQARIQALAETQARADADARYQAQKRAEAQTKPFDSEEDPATSQPVYLKGEMDARDKWLKKLGADALK